MNVACSLTGPRAVRFFSIAAYLVFLCSTGVSQERNQPQTPRSEPEPPAVLKVTTRLVTVDVVARDRHGNPVRDLTAKDFQISEQSGSHKSQQQIASFRLLDRSLAKASDPERAALQLPAGVYESGVYKELVRAAHDFIGGWSEHGCHNTIAGAAANGSAAGFRSERCSNGGFPARERTAIAAKFYD